MRIGGESLLFQLSVKVRAKQLANRGKEGNADDHTYQAHEGAHDGDGDHDAKRADTGVVSKDVGTDDIAVKLLNKQNEVTYE